MELELVEDAGGKRELRDSGPVDQHVHVARSLLGVGHRSRDVVDVGDERPLRDVDAGLMAGEDKDRDAIVVVTAPAARRLECSPAGDGRAGRHEFIDDLAVDPARTADGVEVGVAVRECPLVEAVAAVAEPVVGRFVWSGDESVEGHGHVEHGCGKDLPFP